MKRMAMKQLMAWKDTPDRKPLLMTGVRQCGKTYLLKQFGEDAFEDTAYFNFEENEALASVFNGDLKIDRILDELGNVMRGKAIIPGKTLLILDEIQVCPRALTSLKYFCENRRDLHVIAAGSLLGVTVGNRDISFPVGKVNRLRLRPMSFEEFVCADGGENLIGGILRSEKDRALPEIYTIPLTRWLKLYYVIGGMPEVVQKWVDSHQMEEVLRKQDEILEDYANDFGKHAPVSELPRIRLIWDAIPGQLAKDNQKFVFSRVKTGGRAKDLEDALKWLTDAGLVEPLYLVQKPELPLSGEADYSSYKVYLADVGLLCRRSRIHYRTILDGDDQFIHFKGALTENYVLLQLRALGMDAWYWRSDANAEIDFLLENEGSVIPVEVKSADNTKAKSLKLFCDRYHPSTAVKTSLKNIGCAKQQNTRLWSVPLYALFRLRDYLTEE